MATKTAAQKRAEALAAEVEENQPAVVADLDEPIQPSLVGVEDAVPRSIVELISIISKEAGALAPESKGGVPFPFRGVDGTVNHLAPKLQKYGVIVVPEVLSAITTPNAVGNRTVKTSEVTTRFTFYAPDGSYIQATTAGLADDFADRSVAQAQSVAYRIALLQTFSLPTQSPEPEESGQAVQDGRGATPAAAPQQPRALSTITNAGVGRAPETAAEFVAEIKKAAGAKGLTGAQINAKGQELANDDPDWMNNTAVLKAVLDAIRAVEAK